MHLSIGFLIGYFYPDWYRELLGVALRHSGGVSSAENGGDLNEPSQARAIIPFCFGLQLPRQHATYRHPLTSSDLNRPGGLFCRTQ